jgi:hypothetical protein
MIELSAPIIYWSFTRAYFNEGIIYFILKGGIPTVVYAWYNNKFRTGSIYARLTPFFVYSICLYQNLFSLLLAMGMSIYLTLTQKNIYEKLISNLIAVMLLFYIKFAIICDHCTASNLNASLVFFSILLLVSTLLIAQLHRHKHYNIFQLIGPTKSLIGYRNSQGKYEQ